MTQSYATHRKQQWGQYLRRMRSNLDYTLEDLALAISLERISLRKDDLEVFSQMDLVAPGDIPGYLLSRFESAERVPRERGHHIFLIWCFVRFKQIPDHDSANTWLELGGHGNLTDAEVMLLFGSYSST